MAIVVNPFDQSPVGEVDYVDWLTIDKWLDEQTALHRDPSQWLPNYRRAEILRSIAAQIRERAEELALQIASEGGKPLIDARIEVARAISSTEQAAEQIAVVMAGEEILMDHSAAGAGRKAWTTREPIGPVVAISAFNHPLNLIVHQVATAIATGCPVLVKPADDTPLSARTYCEMAVKAGLDERWCRFALCEIPVAEKMVTDPRVAFFTFIGSAKVGWSLAKKLAPGTRYALEHGGAAPVIVDHDVDLDTVIPSLLKGGFYHSGQVCVSVQRIFVPRNAARNIADLLAQGASKLVVGNAIFEETDCGPLIRHREVDRVASWVDEAKAGGAEIFTGGSKISDSCYAPTVLFNPPADAKVSTMEIFGPAVCVYEYDELDDAISRSNSLPFAFHAAVYSQRLDIAHKCIRELDATAVMVNDHSALRVDWMPFAGRRQSGFGVGGIGYTMRDMVHEKMAVFKL